MRLPRPRPVTARVNMTPLIDVTFLLIIFFLLSSRLAQQETQLKLDLPAAASAGPAVEDGRPRLTVNVSSDGRVMLSSTETSLQEVTQRLRIERDRLGDDLEVRVRADRSVPYSAVEPILLACAEAGIWNVAFAVTERVESRESRVESQNQQ